jgi:hypothetical protein
MLLLYSCECFTFNGFYSLTQAETTCQSTGGTINLTDVLNSLASLDLGAKVPPHCTLKYLHHEGEKRTCQSGVPPAFRAFITNEGMLGLYL